MILVGVFEDIFVKAKSAANVVGQKAGLFFDVSKLNIELAEFKSELKKKHESLGKIIYHAEKNDNKNEGLIKEIVGEIDEILGEIDKVKDEIASKKNKVFCKKCENQNNCDSKFCSKCGEKLENNFAFDCSCDDSCIPICRDEDQNICDCDEC